MNYSFSHLFIYEQMLLMCPLYADSVICCDVGIHKTCIVPAFREPIIQWEMHTCKDAIMIQNGKRADGEALNRRAGGVSKVFLEELICKLRVRQNEGRGSKCSWQMEQCDQRLESTTSFNNWLKDNPTHRVHRTGEMRLDELGSAGAVLPLHVDMLSLECLLWPLYSCVWCPKWQCFHQGIHQKSWILSGLLSFSGGLSMLLSLASYRLATDGLGVVGFLIYGTWFPRGKTGKLQVLLKSGPVSPRT